MKSVAVPCLLVLLALPAAALEPYLVKDINPVPDPAHSSPEAFVTLGGAALFVADDGLSGRELWRSDGTAAGTWQVADLCKPDCSGNPGYFALTERLYFFLANEEQFGPDTLWATDGTPGGTFRLTDSSVKVSALKGTVWMPAQGALYFPAEDPVHGLELWRSDGTAGGTHPVADLRPGPAGSGARSPAELAGRIYFAADDGRGGALWRTDGTAAGTVRVKATGFLPALLRNLGKRLVFLAFTPQRGHELWASDGTAKKTAPISDIVPGPGSASIRDFAIHGSRMYFVAEDGRKGQELWVTDGTAAGTRGLTSLRPKEAFWSSELALYLPWISPGGRFVFAADDGIHGVEPWVTDGTPKGTRLLRDLCPGACPGLRFIWFESLPGRLFFSGTDGSGGDEPWVTDGTAGGTRLLRDLCPGSCDAFPFGLSPVGGRLLFSAEDDSSGRELWATDGTASGTARISDFPPDRSSDSFEWTAAPGQLLFSARDEEHGLELWRADGTAGGTRLVRDINDRDFGGSYPSGLRALDDRALFFAFDGGSGGLWESDGTGPGTGQVRAFEPGEVDDLLPNGPSDVANGRLFFFLRQGAGAVLWRTDGTEAGTFRLTADGIRACCVSPEVRAVGSLAFFAAREEDFGTELWASDGTAEGTRRVRDAEPGISGSEPRELTAFQGKLYYSASGLSGLREFWASDGTEAGTVQIKDIHPGHSSDPTFLTVHAGRLWFFADDGEHGRELWSSDGTGAGTSLAVELEPGLGSFSPNAVISLGDKLLLSGSSPAHGSGLWVTDGTAAGTRKIDDKGLRGPFEAAWTRFQGRLFYLAADASLRVTDGTEAGTAPLLDRDGLEIHGVVRFAILGDRLLFTTREPAVTLWESDGTSAGTFPLLRQTFSGFGDAGALLQAGGRVFFPSHHGDSGVELWAVRP